MPPFPTREFAPVGSNVIASFDSTDLVTRTGHITLFGINDKTPAFWLSTVPTRSDSAQVQTTDSTVASEAMRTDVDYDVEFKQSQTLEGDAFVNLSYEADGGGTGTMIVFTKITVIHYDGTTETTIGTQQQTGSATVVTSSSDVTYNATAKFTIAKKHFKTGDILRLNVQLWTDNTHASNTAILYHDGLNRDVSGETDNGEALPTHIKFVVPFRIGL